MTTTLLEEPELAEAESEDVAADCDASSEPAVDQRTLADLIDDLGGIDPARIRMVPPLGTGTVDDAEKYECELIDGTLVSKDMSFNAYLLGVFIAELFSTMIRKQNLGFTLGKAGFLELFPGTVRAADVAFISWARMPLRKRPGKGIPALVPDLCVEVLSPGNTKAEMKRKRGVCFTAGVRLVWEIDPETRTAVVYTADDEGTNLTATDTLDGRDVLPGFVLPLAELFAELDREAPESV